MRVYTHQRRYSELDSKALDKVFDSLELDRIVSLVFTQQPFSSLLSRGSIITDAQLLIQSANDLASQAFGVAEQDLCNSNLLDLISAPYKDIVADIIASNTIPYPSESVLIKENIV
jgi:hypothetical protein